MEKQYMKRAIELSQKAIGYTNSNPLVGAVIVKNGRIIGEGYHEFYGGPHAEINAFKNCIEDTKGAEMYVTLEPCSHYGKTPPCADEIIKKGIKKVIVGMKDPNPLVSGKGIEILKKGGIEVYTGVLQEEIEKLNEIFIKYITTKTPFCILKTAMTLDGKIATSVGDSKWISNEKSREYVHKLRHRVAAIMVGIGTIRQDDPSLTTRLKDSQGKDSLRVIVDTKGTISLDAKVLNLHSESKTIIATTEKASKDKIKQLISKGAEVIVNPLKDDKVDLVYLMKELGKRGVDSVLLEGGGSLNYEALRENIVDKVIYFICPKIIGGKDAKTPVEGQGVELIRDAIKLERVNINNTFGDIFVEAYVKNH